MKNWRELGEVPGSDEDDDSSFDDDDIDLDNIDLLIAEPESQNPKLPESAGVETAGDGGKEQNTTPDEGQTSPATEDVNVLKAPQDKPQNSEKPGKTVQDIWDIPSSPIIRNSPIPAPVPQPVTEPPRETTPVPNENYDEPEDSPLSPAKSDIWSLSSLTQSQNPKNPDLPALEVRIPYTIPDKEAYVKDDTPKSPVREEEPTTIPSSPSSAGTITPRPREVSQAISEQARSDGSALGDGEDGEHTTGRRSLRPRKPIQQHPYLIENVRYAKVMKSHGIKPIKVVLEESQRKRKGHDEDSQEQDFVEEEESQETTRGEPTQITEESGPILWDDDDELALSPSPVKTSSPARHLRASSVLNSGNQTDVTALSDAEEFPDFDQLPSRSQVRKRLLKRQSSNLSSARSKKQKTVSTSSLAASPIGRFRIPHASVWDLSPSPTAPRAPVEPSSDLGLMRPEPRSLERASSTSRSKSVQLVEPAEEPAGSPIFIRDDNDSAAEEESDLESLSRSHHSDSESDVIRETSRKIRGVLPASWLRLDQKKDGPAARHNAKKDHEPPIDRLNRKGVALPRPISPSRITATQFPFDLADESEDEASQAQNRPPAVSRSSPSRQTRQIIDLMDDDDGFMIEEDSIDPMLAGRKKRAGSPSLSRGAKKQKTRQPKITQSFSRSKSASGALPSARGTAKSSRKSRAGASVKSTSRKRAATPPLLSILDVIEPNAPKFIKIAARSAKKRPDLGKSSSTRKAIRFANRQDNIDALSTLRDWKSGKTRPRVAAPPRKRPESKSTTTRAVLGEVSNNVERQPSATQPLPSSLIPRKLVVKKATKPRTTARQPSRTTIHQRGPAIRPAQLETSIYEDPQKRLKSKKRSLDALFRQDRRAGSVSSLDRLESLLDISRATSPEPFAQDRQDISLAEAAPVTQKPKAANQKTRYRKRRAPQHVDVEAPQYARADDPLPAAFAVVEEQAKTKDVDKLTGLGPYGTQYTHHFEVFPLDHGTFFHESTIIGRGYVKKAVESGFSERIRRSARSTVSFDFQGQSLHWGMWDDQVSSELGILVDWVAEQLEAGSKDEAGFAGRQVTDAANFVMEYVLDVLRVQGDLGENAFVSRWLEVMTGFVGRLEAIDWQLLREQNKKNSVDIAVRLCLAMLPVYLMAQSSGDDPLQSMKLEGLLTKLAKVAITGALNCGLEDLRTLYGELQRPSFRERGIRPNQTLAVSWIVLMHTLESAGIPRSRFWDVVQSVMLTPDVVSGSDAQVFERLWQDMFTLLPLGEIDNMGILLPGLRNTVPLEGWTLPQKLMKRVFELYKSNQRQSPSFNEYCRALIGRCYFLVQQWGWRRCTGIIGTIFDFFGSQNLCHLRNEQVYKSPRFLEELADNPSLVIELEDRCFHIFIKLLALTVQHLKQLGRTKDIRNLVARTLPNHDRQYLKEDTIHERDLAALRNHHDLLCTLFWAAPPDLRPRVDLIERLITPSNAHKEACLINIRAWSQLARFMVTKNQGSAAFRPFSTWRNNVFNQILEQYLSAESDIEQQFRELSAENMRSIDAAWRDELIRRNKATALDILHTSARASLDVLKHAKTLEAVIYTLNVNQLQKMSTSVHFGSSDPDWGLVNTALDTHTELLEWIEKSSEEEYSSNDSGENVDPAHVEESILLLKDRLSKDFFSMARDLLGPRLKKGLTTMGKQNEQAACTEKAVILAAKIAAMFINQRMTQLLPFFQPGAYCLFPDIPKNLTGPERRWLPLFVATLVKKNVFDFKDIETNILSLWMQFLIKPARFFGYETYLAEVLQQRCLPFVSKAGGISAGMTPDYNLHRDLFSHAIYYMRKSLRPPSPDDVSTIGRPSMSINASLRRQRDEYAQTLQLAMTKMKQDLSLLRSDSAEKEHKDYTAFVHQVISLIKSHGVGITVVDNFFLTPSDSYSPPLQDPQLHTAGILAYGVRLSEKETMAGSQLFYYLFTNFKVALANDSLRSEREILQKALSDAKVTGYKEFMRFMLDTMIPVVIQVAARVMDADDPEHQHPNDETGETRNKRKGEFASQALLECYAGAVTATLIREDYMPRVLPPADTEVHGTNILRMVVWWCEEMYQKRKRGRDEVSKSDLVVLNHLVRLCVALQSSIYSLLFNEWIGKRGMKGCERLGKVERWGPISPSRTSWSSGGRPWARVEEEEDEKYEDLLEIVDIISRVFDMASECIRRYLFPHPAGSQAARFDERPHVEDQPGFIRVEALLRGLPPSGLSRQFNQQTNNPRMDGHVNSIIMDMASDWVVLADGRISTQTQTGQSHSVTGNSRVPGQQQLQFPPSGNQSGATTATTGTTADPARSQGTAFQTAKDREELLKELYKTLGEWTIGLVVLGKKLPSYKRRRMESLLELDPF
ncbi:Mus7/MMS22 family-domain-containing protein [Sordaria brevicollis]|uniref:Mus7/MMS22 family-domain-containing protein n=1 Tax=Sordaria brevicollis TaxID=83679 RepID=A0AAE0P3H1_SORBR|nr:Mus7/MMS22 family-domain-containing protein [Sordaria brevicollis]